MRQTARLHDVFFLLSASLVFAPSPPAFAQEGPAERLRAIVEQFQHPPAEPSLRNAHYDGLVEELQNFLSERPPSDLVDDANYWIAEAAYRKEQLSQALERFERFLEIFPASNLAARARHFAGNSLYRLGRYSEAAQAFVEVGRLWPDDPLAPLARYQAGLSYEKAGEIPKARNAYEAFLAQHPDHFRAAAARHALAQLALLGPLPPFKLADVDGREVGAATIAGREALLLFFMAGWDPSLDDLERASALRAAYGAERLEIVALALDGAARKEEIRGLRHIVRFEGILVHLAEGFSDSLASSLAVRSVPTAVFVDRGGSIVRAGLSGPAIVSAVAERLGAPPRTPCVPGLHDGPPQEATEASLANLQSKLEEARAALREKAKAPPAERLQAIHAFGSVPLDASVDDLAPLLAREEDFAIRQAAASALGRIGTRKAGRALLCLLADTNDLLVAQAVDGLSGIGRGVASVEDFGKVLSSRSLRESRVRAAKALAAFPTVASFALQLAALTDLETEPEPRIRAQVLDNARSCEDPAVGTWAAREVLGRNEGATAASLAAACILAGAAKNEDAFRALRRMLKAQNPALREAAAEGLGRLGQARAVAPLEEHLRDGAIQVATASLRALRAIGGEAAFSAILKATHMNDQRIRAAAARALAGFPGEQAFKRLASLVSDKAWPVQAQAIAALVERREKQAIPVLIEAMRKAEGRIRAEVHRALVELTGKDMGEDPRDWLNFWLPRAEDFVVPPKDAPSSSREVQFVQSTARNTYFGLEIVSERLLFVIDFSGSMSAEQTIAVGEDAGKKIVKLEYAKRELKRAISRLGRDAFFNVIAFDDHVLPWQPRLTRATPAAISEAQSFAEKLRPRGGTNIYDALVTGLGDPNLDTIYFLTDGAPSTGRYTDPERILAEVRKLNESRAIQINAISFAGASTFLKRLAEENHGVFVER